MQDNFLEVLQNGRFGFDVAEQTLNFYKDNKIVMMFGIIPKTP
jgi:GH35 family endo-1,4-beta-xylanase